MSNAIETISSPARWKRLPREFFARDTQRVAKALLGKLLVRRYNRKIFAGRIMETESYVGEDDAACHASRGRTPRTEVMYGAAGYAYVYLIYGCHYLFNIITERTDFPAAVLIRSLAPVSGITQNAAGPGRLTKALHIDAALKGEDLITSDRLLAVDDGFRVKGRDIAASKRIGVDYAGEDAALPWRYYIKSSAFVSRR